MKYIDTHCHVYGHEYDADRNEVIKRAEGAGVGMILIGTNEATSKSALELAVLHDRMWAVVGCHPIDAVTEDGKPLPEQFNYDVMKGMAQHSKVVGIGECGLDYFHVDVGNAANVAVIEAQKQVFEMHIRLANEVGKPLVLHIRNGKRLEANAGVSASVLADAYADALVILKKMRAEGVIVGGVVHFFAGDLVCAQEFLDLGFYISFTGVITFAKQYHAVVAGISLHRILSETDAPYVTPVPYRGQRNEPVYVIEVAKEIAKIRGGDSSVVLEALVNNAKVLFNI